MKTLFFLLFLTAQALCFTGPVAGVYTTDGSSGDVQAAHDAAAGTGEIIDIPPGTWHWTTRLIISKNVHIRGAGSGRVVAQGVGSNVFGTGSKTFTVESAKADEWLAGTPPTIADGTTLRVWKITTDKDAIYMLGTKTSAATNQWTLNITSNVGGGGTENYFLIATEPQTTVIDDYVSGVSGQALVTFVESTTGNSELSGIQFNGGTGDRRFIVFSYTEGGNPSLLHDCWFNQTAPQTIILMQSTIRGVIWNLSVTWTYWAQSNSEFFQAAANNRGDSWTTPDTFGMADTGGTHNVYIEDIDIHGCQSATDFDANSRNVWRHNLNDHAMLNSHGCDTGPFGVRQWEVYNCPFIFKQLAIDPSGFPLAAVAHILFRGGTGVITDCYFDEMTSMAWGAKPEWQLGIWSLNLWCLQDNHGNFQWSANDGGVVEYPAPRSFGHGYIDGTGLDGQGENLRFGLPVGESDPAYMWNNTFGGTRSISHSQGQAPNLPPDDINDYLQEGRDYFLDVPKPGYVKFTYPHPLRGAGSGGSPATNFGTTRKSRVRGSSGATSPAQR